MNRSEVYGILKETFNTYHTRVNNKTYKKLFIKAWTSAGVWINEKVYVSNVHHCYICNNELVLRDKYGNMQINVKYKDIESIQVFEHYDDE